ncbi:hypothetical protein [Streptomyces yaizuensis]|uniref:Uncharacterized protein n=1 Tax=Streptomyces yaizuensis TaxID=2989713 RepID=A0AA86IVG5_9ACTN|nr:hypothetical protein [Streptomyces sp. YSPA8]BDT39571.1 hypothetical protein SYYSPA8_37265 [Streptomyces sp. YSPA8]
MSTVNHGNPITPREIGEQTWAILRQTVSAHDPDAECATCGYGLVELPQPIRLSFTAGGGELHPGWMEFAHWADDEQLQQDAASPDFEACAIPAPRDCGGLYGAGCEGLVQLGEEYCGACLTVEYGVG